MAMAREIMQGGVSAGQARAINGFQNTAVSAAGTTIADATALAVSHNVITSCASGAGVKLPSCEIGDEIFVFNNTSTNSLLVYPDTSLNTVNQLGAGVAANIAPMSGALFKKASATAYWGMAG